MSAVPQDVCVQATGPARRATQGCCFVPAQTFLNLAGQRAVSRALGGEQDLAWSWPSHGRH